MSKNLYFYTRLSKVWEKYYKKFLGEKQCGKTVHGGFFFFKWAWHARVFSFLFLFLKRTSNYAFLKKGRFSKNGHGHGKNDDMLKYFWEKVFWMGYAMRKKWCMFFFLGKVSVVCIMDFWKMRPFLEKKKKERHYNGVILFF